MLIQSRSASSSLHLAVCRHVDKSLLVSMHLRDGASSTTDCWVNDLRRDIHCYLNFSTAYDWTIWWWDIKTPWLLICVMSQSPSHMYSLIQHFVFYLEFSLGLSHISSSGYIYNNANCELSVSAKIRPRFEHNCTDRNNSTKDKKGSLESIHLPPTQLSPGKLIIS